MKTNKGLVEYCKQQLDVDTIYVLGTCGWKLTQSLLDQKCNQLEFNRRNKALLQKWLGRKAFDCCGLIKAYLWDEGYDAKTDENEAMMLSRAKVKGKIATLPEVPGVLVFMPGHVGVYIGNGEVIEATPSNTQGWGVLKSKLKGRGWTDWAQYNHITYVEDEKPKEPNVTLKHKVGEVVQINGVYTSSTSDVKLVPRIKTGRITDIKEKARNPYLLNEGNIGWTNDTCIISKKPQPVLDLTKPVKIKKSATKYATGETIQNIYKGRTYHVMQTRTRNKKKEALIKELYSWVYQSDLEN